MSIYKVDKSWRAEISFRDPLTGKYRKKESVDLKLRKRQKHGLPSIQLTIVNLLFKKDLSLNLKIILMNTESCILKVVI